MKIADGEVELRVPRGYTSFMKSLETSQLKGFSRATVSSRIDEVKRLTGVDLSPASTGGLMQEAADRFVENAVGSFGMPLGIATNFIINGQEVLVPMAVEEPSVIAAACNAARMARFGGGFVAETDPSITAVQIEVLQPKSGAAAALKAAEARLLALANQAQPGLLQAGGGAVALKVRECVGSEDRMVVHLMVDCKDAMGANTVNTMAEAVSEDIVEIAGGRAGLRILSNLADERLVHVTVSIPFEGMKRGRFSGAEVSEGVVRAFEFAAADPYRAATHNKGIFNGIDAVLLATGNDWRAVEAGGHAYAAVKTGTYSPLSTWRIEGDTLRGTLEMPMAVGIVGGASVLHPIGKACIALMGIRAAGELACVVGAAGLAANLAALAALSSEGIQFGHMRLHARRKSS